MDGKRWMAPLAGLAFLIIVIIGFTVSGEPPDATDKSPQELVDYYVDNNGAQIAGALLEALAAAALVFYGGALRRFLADAAGERGGTLSAVAMAGLVILATGLAFDSTITFTITQVKEDVDPIAVQTLSALFSNDFMPMAVGTFVFLLSTGLSVLRHGALPKWIGWVALVLALLGLTPIGFVAFLGGGLLIGVTSVMMALRLKAATA